MFLNKSCRICGCTENNACITKNGPCWWVEDDLCSACEDKLQEDEISTDNDREDVIPADFKKWISDSFTDKEQKIMIEDFSAYFRKRKERLNWRSKNETSN